MGAVTDADRETFGQLIAHGDVLVDVWGPDCQPCLALTPHVEELAAEHESLRVVKLEAPKNRRVCMDLRIMGLPAFLLFRDGDELARLAGPNVTPSRLRSWVEESLDLGVKEVS